MIPLNPISNSSAVEAMGYDPGTQTLAVRYKGSSKTTHFKGVEPHILEQANAADSLGGFLNSQVRGTYDAEVIADDEDS